MAVELSAGDPVLNAGAGGGKGPAAAGEVVEDRGGSPAAEEGTKPTGAGGSRSWVSAAVRGRSSSAGGAQAAGVLLGVRLDPRAADRPAPPGRPWTPYSPPGTALTVELPGTPTAGEKQSSRSAPAGWTGPGTP